MSFCIPSLDKNECNGSVELPVHDQNNTLGREEVEVGGAYVVVTLPDLALPHFPFNLTPCCSMIQFIESTQFVHDFIIFMPYNRMQVNLSTFELSLENGAVFYDHTKYGQELLVSTCFFIHSLKVNCIKKSYL